MLKMEEVDDIDLSMYDWITFNEFLILCEQYKTALHGLPDRKNLQLKTPFLHHRRDLLGTDLTCEGIPADLIFQLTVLDLGLTHQDWHCSETWKHLQTKWFLKTSSIFSSL